MTWSCCTWSYDSLNAVVPRSYEVKSLSTRTLCDSRAVRIRKKRFLSNRLAQNPLLECAATHWDDHVRGEQEHRLQGHILELLGSCQSLASAVQI